MQLLWLMCHLTVVTAMPALPPSIFTRIWKNVNTMNDTEADSYHDYRGNPKQNVCESEHCYEIAKRIQQSRDTRADPCEDFYQYACGSWDKYNPVPENKLEWSEDHIIADETNKRVREVLEEYDNAADIPPVRMAKKLYRSCMDIDAIEKRGIKPILEIVDKNGGWPAAMPMNKWNPNKVTWQKIDKHYVTLIGDNTFYNFEYEIDLNDTKHYVLTIDQEAIYPLSSKIDLSEMQSYGGAYMICIMRVAQAFAEEKGYTLERKQLTTDVLNMMYFELKLIEIIETGKEIHTNSDNYERMTIKELQKWYNSSGITEPTAKIDFLDMLQHIFKLANITITSSEPIMVYNPKFLHKLAGLLGGTSERVLVNYIQWNMVNKFLSYTTQEMRDIQFNISFSSYNVSNYVPRWQDCVQNIRMKDAVSYMFVKKYTSDHAIREATKMVKRIKEKLKSRIAQAQWLPSPMKLLLTQKLDNLGIEIGYPKWYKDDDAVTRYYDGLRIGTDYFQNILNCQEKELVKSLIEFREPVVKEEWLEYPITVNAFYTQIINAIFIPAAELRDAYFTPSLPDAINYGIIGFIIGHEISHGFDDDGIKFDKEGYRISWTSRHASDEHKQRSKCFVDQYGNYTFDSTDENGEHVKLDGYLTKNENMADSVGIQIAYSAYKTLTEQKKQTKLPGLEHISNDELFFLTFANSWCSTMRPQYEQMVMNDDEHSPAKYRIIGSLSNMAAFSKTFKCPRNSSMNRRHKCTLWN
ncbi:PREDICTED: membrane metallo-endopeptidase-like 1 [Eufriesea mexicana]|uniref:membrane metallo-endopeptidase-like 1 n=1 Tax=Eufriesea mexicana TaxID=516756 RepID=UPI00083C7239|nr:PREDICTED: membrane metallo-endopeptidase-like 1 [Eufriesea mexicana]